LSVFLQAEFGVTGLEQVGDGRLRRWVAQRWHCEPKSPADMQRELEQGAAAGLDFDADQPTTLELAEAGLGIQQSRT